MGKTKSDKFDRIIASEAMDYFYEMLYRVRDWEAQKKPAVLEFCEHDLSATLEILQGEVNMILLDRKQALKLKAYLEEWLEAHPAEKRPRSRMRSKKP